MEAIISASGFPQPRWRASWAFRRMVQGWYGLAMQGLARSVCSYASALRPDAPAPRAVRDRGPAFAAVDVDCTTATVVPLLQRAAQRRDVQGPLHPLGRARGNPCRCRRLLPLRKRCERSRGAGDAGQQPQRAYVTVRRPVYRYRRGSSACCARGRRARAIGGRPPARCVAHRGALDDGGSLVAHSTRAASTARIVSRMWRRTGAGRSPSCACPGVSLPESAQLLNDVFAAEERRACRLQEQVDPVGGAVPRRVR